MVRYETNYVVAAAQLVPTLYLEITSTKSRKKLNSLIFLVKNTQFRIATILLRSIAPSYWFFSAGKSIFHGFEPKIQLYAGCITVVLYQRNHYFAKFSEGPRSTYTITYTESEKELIKKKKERISINTEESTIELTECLTKYSNTKR